MLEEVAHFLFSMDATNELEFSTCLSCWQRGKGDGEDCVALNINN